MEIENLSQVMMLQLTIWYMSSTLCDFFSGLTGNKYNTGKVSGYWPVK